VGWRGPFGFCFAQGRHHQGRKAPQEEGCEGARYYRSLLAQLVRPNVRFVTTCTGTRGAGGDKARLQAQADADAMRVQTGCRCCNLNIMRAWDYSPPVCRILSILCDVTNNPCQRTRYRLLEIEEKHMSKTVIPVDVFKLSRSWSHPCFCNERIFTPGSHSN